MVLYRLLNKNVWLVQPTVESLFIYCRKGPSDLIYKPWHDRSVITIILSVTSNMVQYGSSIKHGTWDTLHKHTSIITNFNRANISCSSCHVSLNMCVFFWVTSVTLKTHFLFGFLACIIPWYYLYRSWKHLDYWMTYSAIYRRHVNCERGCY